jgi:hypothetical protein
MSNQDKPWDWAYLSENPNITFDMIMSNPDIPWNYEWMSENKFAMDATVKKRLEALAIEEDAAISHTRSAIAVHLPSVLENIITEYVY